MDTKRTNISSNQRSQGAFNVDESRLSKILAGDMVEMNKYAEELADDFLGGNSKGRDSKNKLSTSQVRTVLTEIQKMKRYDHNKIQLLRPKLAYAAGRHRGKVKDFQELMEALFKKLNEDNFENFKYFIEALVAYHKYHGGK